MSKLTNTPVHAALAALASTSAGFLVNDSPIRSTSQLPALPLLPISPQKHQSRFADLLDVAPTTDLEQLLQLALREMEAQEAFQKERVIELQSTVILQGKYLNRARAQLQAQEKPKGKSTKLVGDGWPRLLTHDKFYEKVIDHQNMQRDLANAKEARKAAQEEKDIALARWKTEDDLQKKHNEEKWALWKAEVVLWEAEQLLIRSG